ncbi:ubiquitin-conjugating enzyme E2 6 [Coprinopsis marcescibilis]|uniref:Ubiquitin-conjugating enzyme E2 6 n=1 Tax=Coprinopsis marcescibilis TaxID=230819 RepID=A0A5C3KXF4_COPMA|nr:ubiquitin-conjugating enzyme E2 6 [Coprinopsis marcescibilis]
MASKPAQKRLSKEFVAMQREPPPFIWAAPDEKNILIWNYLIRGPPDSPYAGGEYHGVLIFPAEYPFKPPGIKMYTPSGRFHPDKKICFSMSDFHPGSWNPAWSVATILTGLLSFMLSDEMTTGSVNSRDEHKKLFAGRSHAWNLSQNRFKEAFPEYCTPEPRDLPNMGEKERGKPDLQPQLPPSTSFDPTPSSSSSPLAHPNHPSASDPSVKPAVPLNGAARPARQMDDLVPLDAGANRHPANATGWFSTWRQVLVDKWQWCALFAVAVMISRFSTGT